MVKTQDTYNPVTGEYVKRISDWVQLGGSLDWIQDQSDSKYKRFQVFGLLPNMGIIGENNWYANAKSFKYDSVEIPSYENYAGTDCFGYKFPQWTNGSIYVRALNSETGFGDNIFQTNNEVKAYFYGWKMCNSDGTSPYYRSEVPYTPATWAEWTASDPLYVTKSPDGIEWTSNATYNDVKQTVAMKPSTKYGVLFNVVSTTCTLPLMFAGGENVCFGNKGVDIGIMTQGNKKWVGTTIATTANLFGFTIKMGEPAGNKIKLKDIRIFELPAGSQIEADFTNLTADELSAKYTFNGLCVKHWKKVTDGTGLTSTLPTATYAGYTPYKMIYHLATPEISYLTPKASIPLYDTNTIVETDTPSDCKADVTMGYKLKDGVTAVAGDITAPTPDYMSTVNSVSEDGLKKGIVRSPNMVTNGNFANGVTGWKGEGGTLSSADLDTSTYISAPSSLKIATSGSWIRRYQSATVSNGKKYYISAHVKSTPVTGGYRFAYAYGTTLGNYPSAFLINGSTTTSTPWTKISTVFTATQSSNIVYGITTYMNSGESINLDDVSLIDLTATFGAGNEPTKEQCDILFATWQDKASTQATLPTLRKIGTVADTYNPETGVLVQRIGKRMFDGNESWAIAGGVFYNALENFKTTSNMTTDLVCSHFKLGDFTTSNTPLGFFSIGGSLGAKNGNFYANTDYKTLAQFKAYLAQQYANGTPVTVYYQLATPVVTTITKTSLPTYKPTTVIESDSTVKGNVSADYKLKANATPVAGDFIASPECVNDIKDLGNSIDVVSSNKNKGQVDLSAIPYNTITSGVYKTNILLSAPLRSVGDVKDRLFKDSDGKWKIERNIGEYVATGFETSWIYAPTLSSNLKDVFEMTSSIYIPKYIGRANSFLRISCSHFNEFLSANPPINNMRLQSGDATINGTWLTVGINNLSFGGDVTKFKDWLKSEFNKGTPVTIQYEKTPTYETLSQELQTKLDNIPTFPEHNYVYTVANDNLQPTLHVDYKKLSWLKSRLLFNTLKIYSRNLTDDEMIQNYKIEKDRFGM